MTLSLALRIMRDFTINFIAGPFLPIPPIKGGGVEAYLYRIALELSKKHKVRIYSRRYKGLKDREDMGNLEIVRIGGFDRTGDRFLDLLKEFLFGFFISLKIKKAAVNHFFHLRSFLVYLLKPKRDRSVVHLQVMFGGITARFLKFADAVVPSSDYTMNYFKERGYIRNGRIAVIPNGVDTEPFEKAKDDGRIRKMHRLTGHKIIGYAGRIAEGKGIEHLIDAFRILRAGRDDVKLLLIGPYHRAEYGDPTFYSNLVSVIRRCRLENEISFTGLVKYEELPGYYAVCDVLSFPSDVEESFGIACIEALACGKPVVVTDSSAFREIITNGADGFIVPRRDPSSIAQKISLLLNDGPLRNRISRAAAERARFYSFESIAARYEGLYKDLGIMMP